MSTCYHYLNLLCPVCGKSVDPYHNVLDFKRKKRVCMGCEEKRTV